MLVMTARLHHVKFLLLFEGNWGVISPLLLIRRDEIRFVLYLPPSMSFQPFFLQYISITCPISFKDCLCECMCVSSLIGLFQY